MKLLIRCKLAFGSRNELVTMFQYLTEYDEAMEKMRAIVETKETYRVNQDDLQEIQKLTKEVTETAAKVIKQEEVMKKSSYRQFKNKNFMFKNRVSFYFMFYFLC